MTWSTADAGSTISRADAITAIKDKAVEQGIRGKFKVTYDGAEVDASELPDQVDMGKVRVSEVLTQA